MNAESFYKIGEMIIREEIGDRKMYMEYSSHKNSTEGRILAALRYYQSAGDLGYTKAFLKEGLLSTECEVKSKALKFFVESSQAIDELRKGLTSYASEHLLGSVFHFLQAAMLGVEVAQWNLCYLFRRHKMSFNLNLNKNNNNNNNNNNDKNKNNNRKRNSKNIFKRLKKRLPKRLNIFTYNDERSLKICEYSGIQGNTKSILVVASGQKNKTTTKQLYKAAYLWGNPQALYDSANLHNNKDYKTQIELLKYAHDNIDAHVSLTSFSIDSLKNVWGVIRSFMDVNKTILTLRLRNLFSFN